MRGRNPLADPTCKGVESDGVHAVYVRADVEELRRRWRETVHENAMLWEALHRSEARARALETEVRSRA